LKRLIKKENVHAQKILNINSLATMESNGFLAISFLLKSKGKSNKAISSRISKIIHYRNKI
jgi:hypothetical protein